MKTAILFKAWVSLAEVLFSQSSSEDAAKARQSRLTESPLSVSTGFLEIWPILVES
jgi:hypothetical protein